jgi:PAS domain S-box-containing protein
VRSALEVTLDFIRGSVLRWSCHSEKKYRKKLDFLTVIGNFRVMGAEGDCLANGEAAVMTGIRRAVSRPDFLGGGGELGQLIRDFPWEETALGTPSAWPQNLRMALRIMLASRQPIWIGWGPDLTYFYNDPYKSIIGGKHPRALGRPTAEVWREIWPEIGPMLATATSGDQGTYVEAQLLIMERNGYPEETYYTFSYSPIPNDDGAVGGIFCANSDDTQRVIGERQLALLRDLAAGTTHARTWQEACDRSAEALATNGRDLPFAMIYILEPDGERMRLAGAAGIERGHAAAPDVVALDDGAPWPFAAALRSQSLQLVADLSARCGTSLPTGPWPQPPTQAAVLPILPTGDTGHAGVLIVGLNPFRLFDEKYHGFLGLISGQVASAIANAQAYEEERRRAEALAEIDRAKTVFFSNVSHEFRTPLTLMIGPIEDALNDTALPALQPAQRNRLDVAHRNSLRLLKLVNSLLDFSRIEAGRVEARFEPTALAGFTAELASNFQSATERAGLALTMDCAPLAEPVHIDRDMWEKIVLNLLSNAFKFTFDGEIAVQMAAAADGRSAELTVRDTGVGIPRHELPRLFERFHRVEGQKSRSFEGSGIGLALVQELVRLHGGSIRVDSEVGRGTAFVVSIPFGTAHLPSRSIGVEPSRVSTSLRADVYVREALRWLPHTDGLPEDEDAAARGAPELPLGSQTDGARILVADDNSDMRNYIRGLLGARWTVDAVADGEAALNAIRRAKPDLVLTDVMMPGLDGFGLLRALRGDAELRDLPVILLSARAGEDARVEGLDAGADDYLTKPFSARELIARVNVNLELARVRREAMRDLRESEARFRNMADNAPVMMWMTDAAGELTYLNRVWSEFTGQTPAEALGYGAWAALHAEDRPPAEQVFFAANAERRAFRVEYRLRRADGVHRWALSAAAPRFGDDGAYLGYIGSVIDITERKEAEEVLRQTNEMLEQRVAEEIAERADAEAQLRQAQKMEAVGKLTGGVAHDFNNVLQVIGGNLQLLARDVNGNLRAEQRLQTAIAALMRGSKLASQLLAFGRRQPLAPKVVNLGRLIRGIDDMLRRALGEGVEIETIIAGGLWNTFVDVVNVENALLNLAINARDAMERHGKLTIEAGNAFLDDNYALRHAEVTPGQYVMVAVTDTGCGIAPELVERVFEPFFTTKPEGQGTGLGLSMVYGFVKQSDGHIKIYSELGHGTTVRLYLPRAKELEDVETDVEAGPATGGTETVLIVEDDEDVRGTVVDLLSDLGYRVLKARDAQSALAIIESGIPIDLLFTDVVMPGTIRSPELARKARERLPNIVVLFTSGYTENAIVHGGRLDDGIDLLSKPYTREALARKIRQVLRNQQQQRVQPPAPSGERAGGATGASADSLRVLLVEDDVMIRFATAAMLLDLGHVVAECSSAAEALPLLGDRVFDVLVTDLEMRSSSGSRFVAEAVGQQPGLRVILASGYSVLPKDVLPGKAKAVLLQKPYSQQRLAEALDAAMAMPS